MERWAKPPVRGGNDNPSFSSTLLDAIYRSIDEADGGAVREHCNGGAPDRLSAPVPAAAKKQQGSFTDRWPAERRRTAAVSERAVPRPRKPDDRRGFPVNSTSSSSDCSSYGGFSSSEAETVPRHAGLRPIRTGGVLYRTERAQPPPPPALASPSAHHHQEKKSASIRSKFRDLRKAKAPASPGARLASFLNSLFTAAGSPRKSKSTTASAATSGGGGWRGGEESACSTASTYSRSCLSKTPSSKGRTPPPAAAAAAAAGDGVKRSVRFYPVSVIVDEDLRPCGQKCLYDGDPVAAAARRPPEAATMAKKRVAELLRGFEEEEDEEGSDSSSDLFELENLTAIGGRGYRDELPVYETTHFGTNRAISHSFIL